MMCCSQVLTFPDYEGLLIRNALIIQLSVERLVLVNNQTQAMQLVRAQTGRQVDIALLNLLHEIHTLESCAVCMPCRLSRAPAFGQESQVSCLLCSM